MNETATDTLTKEAIRSLSLDDKTIVRRAPNIEAEYQAAMRDLLKENSFDPVAFDHGPYDVGLSIVDGRLRFTIDADRQETVEIPVDIRPLRRIVKDYFMMCDSYFQAIHSANTHKIEALDMGRRGMHDEGATQLKDMLEGKISVDFTTARRLFTLISILHIKQ